MTPQDLLFIQAKVSNSFLRAFYPNDYRANARQVQTMSRDSKEEVVRVRKTEKLTSQLDTKLARVLGMLEKEMSKLIESMDNVSTASQYSPTSGIDGEGLANALNEAADNAFSIFDAWRILNRAGKTARAREEAAKKKAQAEEKAAKEKAQAEEKAAREKAAIEERAKPAQIESKPSSTDIKPSAIEEPKLPEVADNFAKNPTKASESAFKAALKKTTNAGEALEALKTARGAIVAADKAATRVLSKILGSKLVRWGGLVVIAAMETWEGWEDYVLVQEAFERGYITAALKSTMVRNIIAVHGVTAVAAIVFGELGAVVGAAVGAPFLGVGAIIGAIAGGVIAGGIGAMAATYFTEALLENKTFSDYFDQAINTVTGSDSSVTPTETVATPSPNLSPISSAAAATPAPGETPALPQAQAESPTEPASAVAPPAPAVAPPQQETPAAVPAPAPVAAPDLAPASAEVPTIDPNRIQQNIQQNIQQVQTSGGQENTDVENAPDSSGSDATITTTSDLSAGPEQQTQPSQTVDGAKLVFSMGGHRRGKPNQDVLNIISKAAGAVGMESITITSGKGDYISDAGKKRGQKTTQHASGKAADVVGFSSEQQKIAFAKAARSFGAGGIGAYADDMIHVDTGNRRSWNWGDPNFPKLEEGGKVQPRDGGTLALIGEGGEPEYVVPQSKVTKFAHEMLAARPTVSSKSKNRTHVVVVPIYT